MKAPKAQEFPTTSNAAKSKPKPKAKPVTVRRSYNLSGEADKKITAVALKLSQERGKVISASEALRVIIDAYKVKS